MENIIIIGGPTASGKSNFALKLAKAINSEVISADSMQIYRDMNIGTAKILPCEMDGITHYMLDVVDANESYSVSNYVDATKKIITKLKEDGKVPIIVGGTGLYIDALLYDYEFNNAEIDYDYRHELENLAKVHGNEYLHNLLNELDSEEAKKIHPNNVKRVIRALEICKTTGGKKSENKKTLRYNVLMFVIDTDREILYNRINSRVDIMMNNGLEEEIRSLINRGITFDMQSMQAIGYKEWRNYIAGKACINEVSEAIKKNSRNYAKRQITWFYNKYRDLAHFVSLENIDEVINMTKKFYDLKK